MENKQIKVIQPKQKFVLNALGEKVLKQKRVCAYCRVSTDNDEQKTSIENQVDEYTKRIKDNPEWEFAGVFIDEGISGTSTKNRKQFNQMIMKARSREIDLIITKSISRFARNTLDCLNYVRELLALDIEIFFEKDNIRTFDPKMEMILTIMSSLAQEEARNTSENVTWTIRKRFKEGKPMLASSRFLGYQMEKKTGILTIVEEEAKVVKELFALYTGGIGPAEIINIFQKKGYKTGDGKTKWYASTIDKMLRNEKYCGDLLLQKTVTKDYLTHKRVKNVDLAPMYHIENNHEPIVSKETFAIAQQIINDRRNSRVGTDTDFNKYNRRYPFSGFIYCADCHRTLKRRYWNYGKESHKVVMLCGSYINGKANCKAQAIENDIIEKATIDVINKYLLAENNFMKDIYKAISSTIDIQETNSKIEQITEIVEDIENKISSLVDLKISGQVPTDQFNSKYHALRQTLNENEKILKELTKTQSINYDKNQRITKIKEILKTVNHIDSLDTDILRAFIYRIIAVNKTNVIFCIALNKSYSNEEFQNKIDSIKEQPTLHEGQVETKNGKIILHYRVVAI